MALKVGSVTEAMKFLNLVREKPEAGDRDRREHSDDQKPKSPKPDEDTATDESVGQAVQAFESDPQAQASGLHASLNGSGPGLRVTLTDCNGAVLRQLSGDEFLRLRQATGNGQDSRGRGKILDQKL